MNFIYIYIYTCVCECVCLCVRETYILIYVGYPILRHGYQT